MSTMLCCVVAAIVTGIDVGWKPLPEGGVEYIVQISPEAVDSLRAGQVLQSEVPPDVLGHIRSYQIVVGKQAPPRELPPKPTSLPPLLPKVPVGEPAVFMEPPRGTAKPAVEASKPAEAERPASPVATKPSAASIPNEPPSAPAEPAKPWLPLSLTLLALFASLGGNAFLGWITWDLRGRCRTMLQQGQ